MIPVFWGGFISGIGAALSVLSFVLWRISKATKKEKRPMNKWWYKAPIILFSALMIATTVVFGKVVSAASGDPEFALIL